MWKEPKIESNGAISIENVRFELVEADDSQSHAECERKVVLDCVKFDLYNSDSERPKFFGHLDIFFNGIGNWCFVDWKQVEGKSYFRKVNLPMHSLYKKYQNREDLILAIVKNVKMRHDANMNLDLDKWKLVNHELTRRTEPTLNKQRQIYENMKKKSTKIVEKR